MNAIQVNNWEYALGNKSCDIRQVQGFNLGTQAMMPGQSSKLFDRYATELLRRVFLQDSFFNGRAVLRENHSQAGQSACISFSLTELRRWPGHRVAPGTSASPRRPLPSAVW